MTTNCTFPGCDRPHHSRGLCSAHNDQRRRGVDLKPIRSFELRRCDFPGCDRGHQGRGLCKSHLAQISTGRPLTPLRPIARKGQKPPCSGPECDRVADAKGLCKAHYHQQMLGKPLVPIQLRTHRTAADKPAQRRSRSDRGKPRVRRLRPASVLPAGWDRPAKPTSTAAIAGGVKEIGPVKPTEPDVLAAALAKLAERDALDLADMLGLERVAA